MALRQDALLTGPEEAERGQRALQQICGSVSVWPIPSERGWRWAAMVASGLLGDDPYDVNWLRNDALHGHLRELARTEHFDCIHVDTIGLLPYAAHFIRIPFVLNHHNVESHMMNRRALRSGRGPRRLVLQLEARKLRKLESDVCVLAASNIVVSELDGQRLTAICPRAATAVVENGVDTDFFQRRPGRDRIPKRIVFAGAMDWYPNREAVLMLCQSIWPLLREGDPRRSLTIVGRNPPREIRAASRDARVQVPGFVDDVRDPLEEASIYVCPIRDGGGTRLKVLDALAMEIPLVATGLAVEGLDLAEGEHFLRAETSRQFVEAVERLERDPALSTRLARSGRRRIEDRYAWPIVARKLEAVYSKVCSTCPPDAPR